MFNKIRLGLVPYLNVKPIVWPLLTGKLRHNFSFTFATPAKLAQALEQKKLDIALIPSIEYASSPEYLILPQLAIAANGAVRSVLLYSKKPVHEIETVALDTASRTSSALLKILFAEHLNKTPRYIEGSPPLDKMLKKADAALIIGDNALQTPAGNCYTLDLSEEWLKLTGQPFVFAFFVARYSNNLEESWQTLLQSKAMGIKMISMIAYQESVKLGIDYSICLDYLSQRICYDLSVENLAGLTSFYRYAKANKLIRKDVQLQCYQAIKKPAVLAPRWNVVNV